MKDCWFQQPSSFKAAYRLLLNLGKNLWFYRIWCGGITLGLCCIRCF
jgi:hypothetical protein